MPTRPSYRVSHLSERLRGSCICRVIAEIADPSTMRNSAFLPSASLSPSLSTGLTLCCRNKVASTATNSTWENFRPTQARGPSAHGTYVPDAGSISVSSVTSDVFLNQRSGRHSRASGPQVCGSVCKACTLMLTAVCGGSTCVLSRIAMVWVW